MYKNSIIFCFIIISISCVSDKTRKNIGKNLVTINLDTEIELPLENSDFFSWYSKTVLVDSVSYLFRENNLYENIQIYDLEKKEISKIIRLNKEGPNGIGSYISLGFHPFSKDSFALVNRLEQMLIMKNGSINKRYDLEFEDDQEAAANSPRNDCKVLKLNDSLYGLPQVKQMDWSKPSFFNQSVFALYNTETKIISNSPVTYPSAYFEKCWTPEMIDPTYTYNPKTKKIVFSYPATHNLIEYDYITNTVKEIGVKPNIYFEEIESFDNYNCSKDREQQDSYYLNTPHYTFIVYDKHSNVFFHFFTLPPPDGVKAEYNDVLTHSQLGVIVLDEDYRIINQTLFEPFTFFRKDYFVSKDGLWLSNNNPENPEFEEDKLKFTLLKIQKDEK